MVQGAGWEAAASPEGLEFDCLELQISLVPKWRVWGVTDSAPFTYKDLHHNVSLQQGIG